MTTGTWRAVLDDSFGYLRQFGPQALNAVTFASGEAGRELLDAVAILRELYAKGARNVPAGAPAGFVPTRWREYLEAAAAAGDATAYRHYWELYGLRDGLRSGDVFVPGSRRYADPASYLMTPGRWETQRMEFCHLVGKTPHAREALAQATDELHTALTDLETVLSTGTGPVRLNDKGELVIPRLTAESVPDEAEELLDELTAMLPRIPLAALLIELDRRTGSPTTSPTRPASRPGPRS